MLNTFIEPLLDCLGPLLQRREAESPATSATDAMSRLDERIAAHIDALALTGGAALEPFAAEDSVHALAALAVWAASTDAADHPRAWQHLMTVSEADQAEPLAVVRRQGSSAWFDFVAAQASPLADRISGHPVP